MTLENEPAKLLLPYLQRSDELQKHEPLVAYYCRLYAMERGLKIPQSDRTKTTNSLLVSLLNQLEKDKKSLKLSPEDNLYLEGFALNIFAKADEQDRAGRADLNTAKTFYAASIFFEIMNQFGPLQPDIEEKQKYAAWKAADIRKALKEGRKPVPGPPGEGNDKQIPSSTSTGESDLATSTGDTAARSDVKEVGFCRGYDEKGSFENSTSIPLLPSNAAKPSSASYLSPQAYDEGTSLQHSANIQSQSQILVSPTYPTNNYSSDYPNPHQQPPKPYNDEQSHNVQPYHQETHHYPHCPPDALVHHSYLYSNFQSYPSFTESSLPAVPSHYPSYYQGSEVSNAASYPAATPPEHFPSNVPIAGNLNREYKPSEEKIAEAHNALNSNYQPPPEKIAEAHKAARFAVGALAFDDIPFAVDHLKKSLELLTNPSASNSVIL